MVYRPKWKIALEQVDRALRHQVRLDWLTFDGEYGKAPEFVCGLDERDLWFVGEVPKSLSCLAVNGSEQRPDAQVKEVTDPQRTAALDLCVDLDATRLDGTLSRDGLTVALEADVHASARFALWFRSIVPHTQPLLFYDEGYTADVPLTTETTEEQLTQPFLVH